MLRTLQVVVAADEIFTVLQSNSSADPACPCFIDMSQISDPSNFICDIAVQLSAFVGTEVHRIVTPPEVSLLSAFVRGGSERRKLPLSPKL